jgi:hypothetical protein
MKAKRDVYGLIKALGYRNDPCVCQHAAEALVELGAPAIAPLSAALKATDTAVRCEAAEVLGKIGVPDAVEPLIAALKDSDRGVCLAAAKALGQIRDPRAVEPLIAALNDVYVCNAAEDALVGIGSSAVEPLTAALKDRNVRKAAADTLDKLGWLPGQNQTGTDYWVVRQHWDNCVLIGASAHCCPAIFRGNCVTPYTTTRCSRLSRERFEIQVRFSFSRRWRNNGA